MAWTASWVDQTATGSPAMVWSRLNGTDTSQTWPRRFDTLGIDEHAPDSVVVTDTDSYVVPSALLVQDLQNRAMILH